MPVPLKLQKRAGCPIVPVATEITPLIFLRELAIYQKNTRCLMYCSPIYMNEMEKEDRKKIDVYCQKIIKDTIEKNIPLYKGTIMIYNTQDIMKCTIRSNP